MLAELLKPRSYAGAELIKKGQYFDGLLQVSTATILRTAISFGGIVLAGFDKKDGLKAAIAANLAITASVFGYYLSN